MGSYLGRADPPQPASTQEVREKTGRHPAARSPPPAAPTHHALYLHPPLTSLHPCSRRSSPRDLEASSDSFVITPRRRYPIRQTGHPLVKVLPTVSWDGSSKKVVLSAPNSKMVCGSSTVRIAPPHSKLMRSLTSDRIICSALPSPSAMITKKNDAELNILQERRKRTLDEEDRIFLGGLENKRRRPDNLGSGFSTLESQAAKEGDAAMAPEAEPLMKGLDSQNSDELLNKMSLCSSFVATKYTAGIPSSGHNAITSSYSSTRGLRGLRQPRKRSGPPSSSSSSSYSSQLQVPRRPGKKAKDQEPRSPSGSTSTLATDRESQGKRAADSATRKIQNRSRSPSPLDSSRPRKRKVQLLRCRRGEPLTLPPGPQLGYPISVEEYDGEKRAVFQWLNRFLEDKLVDAASPAAMEKQPVTLAPAVVGSASSVATFPAPSTRPPLETPKAQRSSGLPASPSSAGVVTALAPSLVKTSGLAPIAISQLGSLPAPAGPSAPSRFKSTVEVPAESENGGPLLSDHDGTTTASSKTLTSTSTLTVMPNCGIPGPPAPMPLATPFPFQHTPNPASIVPAFAGLATATSQVASVTTASTTTDSVSKSAFGFGITGAPSILSSETGTTGSSTAPPFLFGVPPTSGASFTPAEGSTFQFGKPPTMPASATVTTFGQSSSAAHMANSSTAHFNGSGSTLTNSVPITTGQPPLKFGNVAPATFNMSFGSSAKPTALPSLGANTQPTFGAIDGQRQGAAKPALAQNFGSFVTLGNLAAPAPKVKSVLAPTQPVTGSTPQLPLGGLKSTTAALGATANTQSATGSIKACFSIGMAAMSAFGATTQTTCSGTSGTPFTFEGSSAHTGSGSFRLSTATQVTSSPSEAFSLRARQSGTVGATTSFGGTLNRKIQGVSNQDPAAFNVASKPVFGGTSTLTLAQNTPTSGKGREVSSRPTQGFALTGSFKSETPSFSIGTASKIPWPQQRLQARRQRPRRL